MKTWVKDENNPLLKLGQYPESTFKNHPTITGGWRDPMVWKQDGEWLMLIGSRINGKDESGATALLYRSKDLKDWEYLNPLCLGYGRQGEIWE